MRILILILVLTISQAFLIVKCDWKQRRVSLGILVQDSNATKGERLKCWAQKATRASWLIDSIENMIDKYSLSLHRENRFLPYGTRLGRFELNRF